MNTSPPLLREWLASQPFGLALSSGFFGFFSHLGVTHALFENNLKPTFLSGASAGAIIAGSLASGTTIDYLTNQLLYLKRDDFWDPCFGVGLLKGEKLRQAIRSVLTANTFSQCRIPLLVSVFNLLELQTKVITSGDISLAVQASCSVPGLFRPVCVNNQLFYDGGILDAPGLKGVDIHARTLVHYLSPSRSPLNKTTRKNLQKHLRDRAATITIFSQNIPAVGPFQLHNGRKAFEFAYQSTKKLLKLPIKPVLEF